MSGFAGIEKGMVVRSIEGEKVGRVLSHDERGFVVEQGYFYPEDVSLTWDEVFRVRGGEVILQRRRDELRTGEDRAAPARTEPGEIARDELSVPVVEEELRVSKRERVSERVRVIKSVRTETRLVPVEIRKEEVRIERVPAGGGCEAGPDPEAAWRAFSGETLVVPVYEEEVEVVKRPVVREEIRLVKIVRVEEREVSGEIRRQDVEVDREAG